jgi:hypothetical protein
LPKIQIPKSKILSCVREIGDGGGGTGVIVRRALLSADRPRSGCARTIIASWEFRDGQSSRQFAESGQRSPAGFAPSFSNNRLLDPRRIVMRRSVVVLALAAFVAFGLSAAELKAGIIPPIGLPAGAPYELIFVTKDLGTATSANIADYNAFVTAEAALNPALPSATWHAVASTSSISASVNAPSFAGIPVYNTEGILVASSAAGLYSGGLVNPVEYDQFGTQTGWAFAWSGSLANGSADHVLGPPGTQPVNLGALSTNPTNSTWLNAFVGGHSDDSNPFFALSDPINTPEPASLALLASGAAAFGGLRLLRRRRTQA